MRADEAITELFQAAKTRRELQFVMALMPEWRGLRDPGWNTALHTSRTHDEYVRFIGELEDGPMKVHVQLAFYCHLSEASGFYEIPKNMMRIIGGQGPVLWPFNKLVRVHLQTGERIAPNANKVLKDLIGHAETLGLSRLSGVFKDAFDPDIRNGYAHADYVVWDDGIRLPKRNGGRVRKVTWPEFGEIFERGLTFFRSLRGVTSRFAESYYPPRSVRGSLGEGPEETWRISWDHHTRSLTLETP